MTYGYIYKITNLINGKIYIGQAKDVDSRWYGHLWEAKKRQNNNSRLNNALLKYGFDNFKVDIIDEALTFEELNEKEIYWIAKLDSQNENIGYNIASGGQGNSLPGHRNGRAKEVKCIETGQIFSCIKYALNWLKEEHNLNITGINISAVCKGKQQTAGGYHWCYTDDINMYNKYKEFEGMPQSDNKHKFNIKDKESWMKILKEAAEKKKGMVVIPQKDIVCIETGYVFSCIKDAADWNGGGTFYGILKKSKSYKSEVRPCYKIKNHHWCYLEDYYKYDNFDYISRTVLCEDLNIIYDKVTDASKDLGIKTDRIYSVLKGEQKTAGNHKFKWIEKEIKLPKQELNYTYYRDIKYKKVN